MVRSVLLIGYGNPGRRDDGLGPALVSRLEGEELPGVDLQADYQLNIEHAHDLATYDVVIFADAATSEHAASFYFREFEAGNPTSFSTHSMSPEAVMRLAGDLFQAETKAYVFGITGFEFDEIAEGLTKQAETNLKEAEAFIRNWLSEVT